MHKSTLAQCAGQTTTHKKNRVRWKYIYFHRLEGTLTALHWPPESESFCVSSLQAATWPSPPRSSSSTPSSSRTKTSTAASKTKLFSSHICLRDAGAGVSTYCHEWRIRLETPALPASWVTVYKMSKEREDNGTFVLVVFKGRYRNILMIIINNNNNYY